MNRFIVIVICLYLILSPFYIFQSGVPQPADLFVALGGGLFLFGKECRKTIKLPFFKYVFWLLGLIFIINLTYSYIYYAFYGVANKMYFIPLYYIFNILFMIMFAYVSISNRHIKNIDTIAFFIIISLSIQFILALLGIQGGNKDAESISRPSLFFNNPNQLGYYALSMLTIFFILHSKFKKNIFVLLFTIFISSYLILYSGSRAALAGVILLSMYVIYKEGFKLNMKSIFLIAISFVSIPFLLQTNFAQKRFELIESRNERNVNSGASQAEIRGYDRIYLNPQYLFYGAGEGKNDRFISRHQLEIHSGFGTMLFSYGFLGLFMFLHLIYYAIKKKMLHSFILLLPILVYNITHNGLRNSLLWAIIVSIYISNERKS